MTEKYAAPGRYKKKAPSRGGSRANSGRKTSLPNKTIREVANDILRSGKVTPLEVMLEVMYACRRKKDMAGALEAAKAAAPYIHPRLQAVEMSGRDGKDRTAQVAPVIHLTIKQA